MAENSKIEWCHHTFNPWIGCQKVSTGCDHCYAESMSNHRGWVKWGPQGERRRTSEANWKLPRRWARAARGLAYRPRVFCASLADWSDNKAPPGAREDLYEEIDATPELDWLLLSKRPENILKIIPAEWRSGLPANVWTGTTCEDQPNYERRSRILFDVPSAVHFISYEPALGPLVITGAYPSWIICGGESGHGAREMDPAWARALKRQCEQIGVPFFMKQMTGKKPIPDDLLLRQFPAPARPRADLFA